MASINIACPNDCRGSVSLEHEGVQAVIDVHTQATFTSAGFRGFAPYDALAKRNVSLIEDRALHDARKHRERNVGKTRRLYCIFGWRFVSDQPPLISKAKKVRAATRSPAKRASAVPQPASKLIPGMDCARRFRVDASRDRSA